MKSSNLLLTICLFFSFDLFCQEIVVLGTAQDAGYPQAGCKKECCLEASKKEDVASIAFEDNGRFWIIDATPDFTNQLRLAQAAFPKSELAGILITHAHIGHYTGLMYLGREAMNTDSLPVYCLPRMAKFLKNNGPWSQLVKLGNIKIIELENGKSISLSSELSVASIEVPHRDEFSETAGFLIATPEKKTLYIPDIDKWERWSQSIEGYINMVDVALLDATFYSDGELMNRDMSEIPHPFVLESMERLDKLSSKEKAKVYFTHFNHTNGLLQDGEEKASVEKAGFNVARTGLKL